MIAKRNILIGISVLALTGCTLESVKDCNDGATRCVGDTINTCVNGGWWQYTPCEKQKCEEKDGAAVCVHICEKGDTKCSGNTLLTCTDENVWPQTQQGVNCAEGQTCMSVQEFSFCANPNSSSEIVEILMEHDVECNDELLLCGENNTLYTCENNELKELEPCGDRICGQGSDGLMACLDICLPGETKCEGNNLVTCNDNREFGTPEPCVADTVCTKNDDSVYACVEKKASLNFCFADQCIGDTWYQCKNGVYDNGTVCEHGCILDDHGNYTCFALSSCVLGETRCGNTGIEKCVEGNIWQAESNTPEHAFCVVRENVAEYRCELGYEIDGNVCKSLCVEGCSEDGKMAISCPADGVRLKTVCDFGCDSETKKCKSCVAGCSDDGTLTTCDGDVKATKTSCPAGCDAEKLECKVCVPGCAQDGSYSIECTDGAPVQINCSDGCNANTLHCNSCQPQCSQDNQYLIKCLADDSTENVLCEFSCNPEKLECNQCTSICSENILKECQKDGSLADKTCFYGCDAENLKCVECQNKCKDDNKAVLECDGKGGYIEKSCQKTGWKDGTCENAACKYTECKKGYILKDGECVTEGINCDNGQMSAKLSDVWICGVPLYTKDDIMQLYEAVNSGDMTAFGKTSDFTPENFIVMNDIELDEQTSWTGIGTTTKPFTGKFVGHSSDITVKAKLTCTTGTCGFFGKLSNARVSNITFDIDLSSNMNTVGRVAGSSDGATFDDVTVKGSVDDTGKYIAGMVGHTVNSSYDRIHLMGEYLGKKESSEHIFSGGMLGMANGVTIKNTLVNMNIKVNGDKVGAIVGDSTNVVYDNVAFVGTLETRDGTLNTARVGGFWGNTGSSGDNYIINSRVIAQIKGGHYIGGMTGHQDSSGSKMILNSFSIAKIISNNTPASAMASDTSFIQNVYSLGKSEYHFVPSGGTVTHGYYDATITANASGSTVTEGDTITYDGANMMLNTNKISLVEQLNNNLAECNKKAPTGYTCHEWKALKTVNVENIVGHVGDVQLPFPADSVSDEEIKAIEALNNQLKI